MRKEIFILLSLLLLLYFFRREIHSGNKRLAAAAVEGERITTCDIFIGADSLNNRQFPEPAKGFEPSVYTARGYDRYGASGSGRENPSYTQP
jgi:hypothetical protein